MKWSPALRGDAVLCDRAWDSPSRAPAALIGPGTGSGIPLAPLAGASSGCRRLPSATASPGRARPMVPVVEGARLSSVGPDRGLERPLLPEYLPGGDAATHVGGDRRVCDAFFTRRDEAVTRNVARGGPRSASTSGGRSRIPAGAGSKRSRRAMTSRDVGAAAVVGVGVRTQPHQRLVHSHAELDRDHPAGLEHLVLAAAEPLLCQLLRRRSPCPRAAPLASKRLGVGHIETGAVRASVGAPIRGTDRRVVTG
ncbi:MAG: hypothetical protein QOG20_363 [Pseudonocardiales bacterium]|jgi:hypothetical protein|nr:hypothetical protein [Pseudonocardiales bacterium]